MEFKTVSSLLSSLLSCTFCTLILQPLLLSNLLDLVKMMPQLCVFYVCIDFFFCSVGATLLSWKCRGVEHLYLRYGKVYFDWLLLVHLMREDNLLHFKRVIIRYDQIKYILMYILLYAEYRSLQRTMSFFLHPWIQGGKVDLMAVLTHCRKQPSKVFFIWLPGMLRIAPQTT